MAPAVAAKEDVKTESPSNADVMAMLVRVMERMAERPDSTSSDIQNINTTIQTTLKALTDGIAVQNARQQSPSNAHNLDGRSFYRPKGHLHEDYAGLKWHRQPWHNGHRITLDEVNPDEIATWNELSALLPTSTSRRTARDGRWKCWVSENNASIYISVPVRTIEDQMNEPATHIFILREFIDGKTIDPASLLAELTALKAELQAMVAQKATA